MSEVAIRAEGLVLQAGENAISDPIDLEIHAGEHVLLLGPSGAGKSTFLRTIAGLANPFNGNLTLFGQLVDEGRKRLVPPHKRAIGYLFQDGALWPQWTVGKTLDFVLSQRGVPKAMRKQEVQRLLEWVELPGFEKRKVPTLSGGEAQRVNLARALACQPKILLLDEPLGPLDKELRKGLLSRFEALRKDLGLTIVHVTHDSDEARGIAQRELTLRHGRLREPSGTLRSNPATEDQKA